MRLSQPLAPAAVTIALVAAAATTAGVAARDRAAGDVPVAIPAGPARDCVPVAQLRRSAVRSDRVIDFMTGPHRAWRVTLPHACPELGIERRFAYATSLNELCATDLVTVLHDPALGPGVSCGLAPFQPVTLPGR